ncbi:phage tail fiber protein [Glutamicibacter sp.]|jgi:hypothetical protein|uniref:phage tail fiber protein n=1 Tax=Glutamicibacter sp. TaxID=1931995 RepID=UPI002FDB010C
MSAITPYLEGKWLGTLFGIPYSAPGLWMGLTHASMEISGANYKRVDVKGFLTRNSPITNTDKIAFPISLGPWGDYNGAYVFDAPQGGNALLCGDLPPDEVKPNRRVVIYPGTINLSLCYRELTA